MKKLPNPTIWIVEFFQNLPLVSAFIFGYAAAAGGRIMIGVATAAAGVFAGVMLIRFTESAIRPGRIERWVETAVNFIFYTAAILLFILYFIWNGGSLLTDIGLGISAGLVSGVLQAFAARESISGSHMLALAASFGTATALIRLFGLSAPPTSAALTICAAVTTIIVLLDYRETG